MGLFDSISSTVVTRYKADTTDHKAAIKSLRGEEKKLAKERLDALEQSNKRIDGHIALIGKIGVAVGAAVGAWMALRGAVRAYAEDAQMQIANSKFSVEGLSKAANGLISDYELLKLAAAASNTDFAITQTQLEDTVKAMLSLRRQGNDFRQVQEQVTKAIIEGNERGLKPFGVILETTGTKAERQARILERLGEEAKRFGGNFSIAGDNFVKAENNFGDAVHQIKVSFGQLVDEALGPLVGELGNVAKGAGDAVKAITPMIAQIAKLAAITFNSEAFRFAMDPGGWVGRKIFGERKTADLGAPLGTLAQYQAGKAGTSAASGGEMLAIDPNNIPSVEVAGLMSWGLTRAQAEKAIADREKAKEAAASRGNGNKISVLFEDPEYRDIVRSVLGIDLPGNTPGARTSFGGRVGGLGLRGGIPQADESAIALQAAQALSDAMDKVIYKGAGETSLMRAVFGPVEELDAYVVGLKAVTDAATAGFDAWVSGSKSVGEAVKMSIVASIAALGKEMFVRSLFHTAAGIGALATPGGQVAAAKHFESAAAYGAGAAIAGTTARLLGGSGGSPGASRAGAGGGVGAVGPSTRSGGTSIFFLGDGFIESSPRQRAARTKKLLDRVGQSAGGDRSDVLEFD